MPTGILPETFRKTIFVLGVLMVTLAGAMERMGSEAPIDTDRCAINIEAGAGNHG